jgi:beta-lactam-binding protein with PASTA domain
VPDVVGLSKAEAIEVLVDAYFTPVTEIVPAIEPIDVVVGQSPSGGASAVAGSQVLILVSNGKAPPQPSPDPAELPPGQEGDLPPGQTKEKGKGKGKKDD